MDSPSMIVFGAQSKAPKGEYLSRLQRYLSRHSDLILLRDEIMTLPEVWTSFASHNKRIEGLEHGPQCLRALSEWASKGTTEFISKSTFSTLTLPLIMIIEIIQYFQFLQETDLTHQELLASVSKGAGVQGFCAGLLAGCCVAVSAHETELVNNACKMLRLAVGIGAYGDLGGSGMVEGLISTVVVRLNYEDQVNEIIETFPQLQVTAITSPKLITVVGSATTMDELHEYARSHNLSTQTMHLSGKMHSSDNIEIANDLIACAEAHDALTLPDASCFKVMLRSNRTAAVVNSGLLANEVINVILTRQCQWHKIMRAAAKDLLHTRQTSHNVVTFGIADAVPLSAFDEAGLSITKFNVLSLTQVPPVPPAMTPLSTNALDGEYQAPSNAIAVIGMACRFPGGANCTEQFWDLLTSGRSTAQEIPKERIDIHGSFRAMQDSKWASRTKFFGNLIWDVDAFDNTFFNTNAKESAAMDPQQRLLLETAYQAVESSGYLGSHRPADVDKVGVYIGASFRDQVEQAASHPASAYTATGTIGAFLGGKISHYFGWSGPAEVIDTACSASAVAIKNACRAIQYGECSMALAGGVNVMSAPTPFMDLAKAGFLSPTGQCKPFDKAGDGYCRADGVGLVFLKGLAAAEADDDLILGVIPGIANNQGSQPSAITIPHSPSQVNLYRDILKQAGMTPEQVSYVECHGTGTQAGDPLEIASVREVYGSKARSTLHLGSVKGSIGHCETAAGVAGVIKALLMIDKGSIPPLVSHRQLNHKIPALETDCMTINTTLQPWKASFRAICVNSYGAAGSNSAMLICQPPRKSDRQDKERLDDLTYPISIGANSKGSLQRYIDMLDTQFRRSASNVGVGDLALSLSRRRKEHRFRLINTLTKRENLTHIRESAEKEIEEAPRDVKRVVLAFSGQSKQAFSIDEGLYKSCHIFRTHLDRCHQVIVGLGITQGLYPAIFQEGPFADIRILQCSMFSMQYTYAQTWISCGLQVDDVVGHSFGELTALAVSGILSLEEAMRLVEARAELMHSRWGSEPGKMLAIHDTTERVNDVLHSLPREYTKPEIACYNSHSSHVIVGEEQSIEKIQEILKTERGFTGIKSQRLDVTHGFHSKFTEGLLNDLDGVAKDLKFRSPKIHLESCTSEQLDVVSSAHIAQQTRKPVFFHQAIQRITDRLGPCLFLEAGVDTPVIGMVMRSVADPKSHAFQAVKSAGTKDPMWPIADTTTNLWKQGIGVKHWSFVQPRKNGLQPIWLPPYQFERTRHWLPYIDRAMEVLESRPEPPAEAVQEHKKRLKMVTSQGKDGLFHVHAESQRFTSLVSGHSVLDLALCPASMYLECVAMAAQEVIGDIGDKSLWFEVLSIEKPLGLASSRANFLSLEQDQESRSWTYKVESNLKQDPKQKATLHGQGRFSFLTRQQMSRQWSQSRDQRMVENRVRELSANPEKDTLKRGRVYSLFGRVVDYKDVLQGIDFITFSGLEAVAEIVTPEPTEFEDTTALRICDTVALDNFLQVAGLLINSSEQHCGRGDCFITTAIDSVFISTDCDFESNRSWTVYTAITPPGGREAIADIFILAKGGQLVATMIGVHFLKLTMKSTRRVLKAANELSNEGPLSFDGENPDAPFERMIKGATKKLTKEMEKLESSSGPKEEGKLARATIGGGPDTLSTMPQLRELLIELVAENIGIDKSDVDTNATFEALGVDSLSLMDLGSEIEEKAGIEIDLAGEHSVSSILTRSEASSSVNTWEASRTNSPTRSTGPQPHDPDPARARKAKQESYVIETVTYKTVDDLDIQADIYWPKLPPSEPMPIALMIHAGGFMTMSKSFVRPSQTKLLLDHGILPVSLDYRLVPEINILDGAMSDVHDGLLWVQKHLPSIARLASVKVDIKNVVVIGWSAGGHLGMSLAWTCKEPPKAILSLYAPSDFESPAWLEPRAEEFPDRSMAMEDIQRQLPKKPISSYTIKRPNPKYSGLEPGDPRSELILGLNKAPNFVPFLLNGFAAETPEGANPNPERVVAISPMAQVRRGNYKTPTFVIHGEQDEMIPQTMAIEFGKALKEAGVESELLIVSGAKHMYDISLKPGKKGWEDTILPGYEFLFKALGK